MGQLLLFFCATSAVFFICSGGVLINILLPFFTVIDGRGFAIKYLIRSDLLNCLRRVGTIAITTESGQNRLKIIFTNNILTESSHFSLFWCIPCAATPEISSVSEDINNTARVSRLLNFYQRIVSK